MTIFYILILIVHIIPIIVFAFYLKFKNPNLKKLLVLTLLISYFGLIAQGSIPDNILHSNLPNIVDYVNKSRIIDLNFYLKIAFIPTILITLFISIKNKSKQ
jgi:hypothetical protein